MRRQQRAWWPAMPDGGHHQTSGILQQDTQNTSHWDAIQQNLSRAMPWASPEHIQAQGAKLIPQTAASTQGLDSSLEHNNDQFAASPITPGPAAEILSFNGKASGPAPVNSSSAAKPPHVLYAALFLSFEQQGILLTRRVPAEYMTVLCPVSLVLSSAPRVRLCSGSARSMSGGIAGVLAGHLPAIPMSGLIT